MDEFEIIAELFAPLARASGAARLTDDVAELATGGRMIATCDAIVAGVHFLPSDPLETVAAKLVRVNVSDIHAKGGEPREALLTLVWPKGRATEELRRFADGLRDELARWGVALIGGDTTSTPGPLTLSMTMTGSCGPRGPVRRSGARPGEDLWVTGAIGDGWLGLQAALGKLEGVEEAERARLLDHYRRPDLPGAGAARLVERLASAAMDVSDGLAGDAGRLAAASGCRVTLRAEATPLSVGGEAWLEREGAKGLAQLMTGGDDYQILFAAGAADREAVARQAQSEGVRVTRIGEMLAGEGLEVIGVDGAPMDVPRAGWRHFSEDGA